MTRERIADRLGARRQGVTGAALQLPKHGLTRGARAHVTRLDRPRLAARSCERSGLIQRVYERRRPAVPAA